MCVRAWALVIASSISRNGHASEASNSGHVAETTPQSSEGKTSQLTSLAFDISLLNQVSFTSFGKTAVLRRSGKSRGWRVAYTRGNFGIYLSQCEALTKLERAFNREQAVAAFRHLKGAK